MKSSKDYSLGEKSLREKSARDYIRIEREESLRNKSSRDYKMREKNPRVKSSRDYRLGEKSPREFQRLQIEKMQT